MKKVFDWVTDKIPSFQNVEVHKPTVAESEAQRMASLSVAPVIWMLGKTGAGKTSIVSAITGCSNAEVGSGYESCATTAAFYDFPAHAPVIRFLDTRGLGEAGYDPKDDIHINKESAHLIIAVVRASDTELKQIFDVLTEVRRFDKKWPVLIVQTGLHDRYDLGADHPENYPYNGDTQDDTLSCVPAALRNSLKYQRELFNKLPGEQVKFVQIDFTKVEDGYTNQYYGFDALAKGIMEVAPEAIKLIAIQSLKSSSKSKSDQLSIKANTTTLYFAAAAAGVGAIPVVGIATVPSTQGAMLWKIANHYGIEWGWKETGSLLGCLGTAIAAREVGLMLVRQFTKAPPWIIPVASIQDYAVTYGLGKAASYYCASIKNQIEPDAEEIKRKFTEGLQQAFIIMKRSAE